MCLSGQLTGAARQASRLEWLHSIALSLQYQSHTRMLHDEHVQLKRVICGAGLARNVNTYFVIYARRGNSWALGNQRKAKKEIPERQELCDVLLHGLSCVNIFKLGVCRAV